MSKRTYAVIAVAVVLVVVGIAAAQWQRARKTAELLDDLDTASADLAVDTLHELKKRGHAIEDELIARLKSDRKKERMRAAYLLGDFGSPEVSGPALAQALEDEWGPVRRAAAHALGRIGYAPAAARLLALIQDEEEEMDTRCIAVQSIGLLAMSGNLDPIDRRICVPPLIKILERRPEVPPPAEEEEEAAEAEEDEGEAADETPADEEAEAEAEAAAPEEEELPEEPEPADTEIELRKQCVLTLGLLNAPEIVEPLLVSIDDTKEPAAAVRECACMAIADLPELPTDDTEAALMGNKLLDALEDSAANVRMHAAMALARHTDFRTESLDNRINDALKDMAQELQEEGEPSYWAREAARVACSRRHVSLHETNEAEEGSS